MTQPVKLGRQRYFELRVAELELTALRAGGVDNWEGYSASQCDEAMITQLHDSIFADTPAIVERHVVFADWEVVALREGRKTQIRRFVRLHPAHAYIPAASPYSPDDNRWGWLSRDRHGIAGGKQEMRIACPYGKPGERLWVKEAYAPRVDVDPVDEPGKAKHYCLYRATGSDHPASGMHWHGYGTRWYSAATMPRWASRFDLELTDVNIARVQDIDEAGAKAEGVVAKPGTYTADFALHGHVAAYVDLCNERHGPYPWEANLWMWVGTVKQVEPARE